MGQNGTVIGPLFPPLSLGWSVTRAALPEVLHDLLGHEVDLLGVVGDRSKHEVLEPRLPQVVDAHVDAVDAPDHVALLQVLVAPMRAHDAEERRLRLRHRLLVARRVHKVGEVAVPEGQLPRVSSSDPVPTIHIAVPRCGTFQAASSWT